MPILTLSAIVPAAAQQVTAAGAAAAMEKVVVDAIARGEKSVVAIGLFHRGDGDLDPLNPRPRFNFQDDDDAPDLEAVPDAYGTGVVIDQQGHILTCWHVLQGRHETARKFIRAAGQPLWCEVRVKAADPFSDLAVLEILPDKAGPLKLQPIALGDATTLRKGQFVIALGNPYAIARDGDVSASWGIVANLNRKAPPREGKPVAEQRPTMHHFGTLIQTDAKLNLGTSGGPLLNMRGEMIGLTTSMAALAGYEKSAGYAIAVDETFRRVIEVLRQGREVEYGFLGVSPDDLLSLERRRGDFGVRIKRVVPGTPAFGLLQMGDVVTHIDGQPLAGRGDLMLAIGRRPAGSVARLTVRRGGQPITLPVKLTKNRVVGEKVITTPSTAWRGIRVEYPAALRSLALPEPIPSECVIVTEVDPHSPAASSGLEVGARISHVEDLAVTDPQQFLGAVAGHTGPVRLRLVDANDRPTQVVVQPDGDG